MPIGDAWFELGELAKKVVAQTIQNDRHLNELANYYVTEQVETFPERQFAIQEETEDLMLLSSLVPSEKNYLVG